VGRVEYRGAVVSTDAAEATWVPAGTATAPPGVPGVVVALQPPRAAHIEALAPSVRVIGRACCVIEKG